MNRIEKILRSARFTLGDIKEQRYSNERLVFLLNEAQYDICVKAKLLRSKTGIDLRKVNEYYVVGSDVHQITRATFKGEAIPLHSHAEMDSIDPDWELATSESEIKAVVYDKLNKARIKLYPDPKRVDVTSPASYNQLFGMLTEVPEGQEDPFTCYGQITGVEDFSPQGLFGGVTDYVYSDSLLQIYYIKKPVEIKEADIATSELEVDEVYDKALKHYIAGMSLRDDREAQNRSLGLEELQLYAKELDMAAKDSAKDSTSKSTTGRTVYRSVFNG